MPESVLPGAVQVRSIDGSTVVPGKRVSLWTRELKPIECELGTFRQYAFPGILRMGDRFFIHLGLVYYKESDCGYVMPIAGGNCDFESMEITVELGQLVEFNQLGKLIRSWQSRGEGG